MQSWIMRSTERHQQRIHYVVHEVQDRREQQAEVTAQPYQALLLIETRQSGLQCKDIKQYGGHGADALLVLVLRQQHPLEEAADVVADEGYDAGHTENGRQGLTAVHQQCLYHVVVAKRIMIVLIAENLHDLLRHPQYPECTKHAGYVQAHPLGLHESGETVITHEIARVPTAHIECLQYGDAVVPDDVFAHCQRDQRCAHRSMMQILHLRERFVEISLV